VRAAVEGIRCGLRVQFVENTDPASPNGMSLLAAELVAAQRFFLQMVDHVFAEAALPKLTLEPLSPSEIGRVLVDRAPIGLDLEDATKVRLDERQRTAVARVSAIGKRLEPWDAVDAGLFLLTHGIFDALRRVSPSEPRTVSSGMRRLAAAGALGAADLQGIAWMDVDTPADRQSAERLLDGQKLPIASGR
jgi:choline kinase